MGTKPTIYTEVLKNTGLNERSFKRMTYWIKWLQQQTELLTYLEIGILYGGTFEKVLRILREADEAIGIDLFEGLPAYYRKHTHGGNYTTHAFIVRRMQEAGFNKFTLLKGDSHLLIPKLPAIQDGYIYIDGNHTYEACRDDFVEVDKILSRGIIHFHDTNVSRWGVKRVVEEFIQPYDLKLIEITHDSHLFLKGVYEKEPA